jgi:hypothetical protein
MSELGFELAKDHMHDRISTGHLVTELQTQIEKFLGIAPQLSKAASHVPEEHPFKLARCAFCERKIDRKTRNRCYSCKLPICYNPSKECHAVLSCVKCANIQ